MVSLQQDDDSVNSIYTCHFTSRVFYMHYVFVCFMLLPYLPHFLYVLLPMAW